jgi:hypothetical protein
MAKKKCLCELDVESLAISLYSAARSYADREGYEVLREIVRLAVAENVDMYGDEPDTSLGSREVLTRFAVKLDEIHSEEENDAK